jgi:hypothetical protein
MYPGSGMGKKQDPRSGMNNPDHISKILETLFWVKMLKFFDADPGSYMEKIGSAAMINGPKTMRTNGETRKNQ